MKLAHKLSRTGGSLVAGAFIALLGFGMPSMAADVTYDFPAGWACQDFDLRFEIFRTYKGGGEKVFYDKNGNAVRWLAAGKSNDFVFTNLNSGATLSVKGKGFKYSAVLNPDGSTTWQSTGHQAIIALPTDVWVPPGPSTTLYVGRLVATTDPDEVYTLISFTGDSTDVCAALSR